MSMTNMNGRTLIFTFFGCAMLFYILIGAFCWDTGKGNHVLLDK